jgi:Bacterial toxin homologue of phage lysozyme, C-term
MPKSKKINTAYSGPALTEANLPAYDKAEIAAERALRQDVKACAEAAKNAKTEIADLKKEQATLDKKSPDYKTKAANISKKIKALSGIAKKTCKLKHPGCVPSINSSKVDMPKENTDAINKKFGTNIDFSKLAAWEGGAFTKAYIPWSPHMDKNENPTIMAMKSSDGTLGPRSKGDLHGQPKNKSGATVGVGVDLGQVSEGAYFDRLDAANKQNPTLTADELTALKTKIKPYLNKQGGEACKYLHDHPLTLSEKETNFLNQEAHEYILKGAKTNYEASAASVKDATKKFTDLTSEQQTALMSNGYQYGSPRPDLVNSITKNTATPSGYRESDYLAKAKLAASKKP